METKNRPIRAAGTVVRNDNSSTNQKTSTVSPKVAIHGQRLIVTSNNIADVFHKRHRQVVRDIRVKIENLDGLGRNPAHYFERRNYTGSDGKDHKSFALTRKGFDYLVLGYNGKKADEYKLEYIDKYHHNANILIQQRINTALPQWREGRDLGKQSRRGYTNAIKVLQGYAKARGSENYGKLYVTYTRMIHAQLFTWDGDYTFNRDDCTIQQIDDINTCEDYCADVIKQAMLSGIEYKTIYQQCKEAVGAIVGVVGMSEVPSSPLGLESGVEK